MAAPMYQSDVPDDESTGLAPVLWTPGLGEGTAGAFEYCGPFDAGDRFVICECLTIERTVTGARPDRK